MAPAPLHGSGGEIDREVARHVGKLQEEVLHHLGLVAERHHEFLEAVGGVELHDVPEHRMLADLHHRLGDRDVSSASLVPNPPARITTFSCPP